MARRKFSFASMIVPSRVNSMTACERPMASTLACSSMAASDGDPAPALALNRPIIPPAPMHGSRADWSRIQLIADEDAECDLAMTPIFQRREYNPGWRKEYRFN